MHGAEHIPPGRSRTRAVLVHALLALAVLVLAGTAPLRKLERLGYDAAVRATAPSGQTGDALILAIDDLSLDILATSMGGFSWPYPRQLHAEVLERLATFGARAVVFDVVFDLPSGLGPEDDQPFARAMGRVPTVLAGEYGPNVRTEPYPLFLDAGAGAANVLLPVDFDGVVRAEPGARGLPASLGESLAYAFGLWRAQPGTAGERETKGPARALLAMLAPEAALPPPGLIRYIGPPGTVPVISYFELTDPALAEPWREAIAGKTVFVGRMLTASITPTLQSDLFLTPYAPYLMPGVAIHAQTYAALQAGRSITLFPSPLFALAYLCFALLAARIFLRAPGPLESVASSAGLAALGLAASTGSLLLDTALPAAPFVLLALVYLARRMGELYLRERDARMLVKNQLFHYLPAPVAEHVLENPQHLAQGGDRREITLLFADVAGFTTLSESLDTETVIRLLQEHLKEMTAAIFEQSGTLDKFLGDGIMAFWGAPQEQPEQSDLALAAARAMHQRLDEANVRRAARGEPELALRIGLHRGEAIVGNVGSELFIDYTAIGDTVNTASRVEGLNKYLGRRLLVTGECLAQLSRPEELAFAGRLAVKGRAAPIALYGLPAPGEAAAFEEFARIAGVLDAGEIDTARNLLTELLAAAPEFGPARFYAERLAQAEPERDAEGRHYFPMDAK